MTYFTANDFESKPARNGDSPLTDSRGGTRYTLLLRSAKLIADGREYVCILRDVSAGGVKLRLFHPLPPSKFLALELGGGVRYPVRCVWQKGEFVGLRFLSTVQVQQLIEENFAKYARRPLRVNLHQTARIALHQGDMTVTLINLSQQGACIDCEAHLLLHQRLRIDILTHTSLFAKVIWRKYPHYGLVLDEVFSMSDLAVLAGKLQSV